MAEWYNRETGARPEGTLERIFEKADIQKQSLRKHSSWISHAEREKLTGTTFVYFRGGYVWQGNMSDDMWDSFSSSPSLGRWWHGQKGNPEFWQS